MHPFSEWYLDYNVSTFLPEESIEHEVGWKNKYGSLSSGDYRIKIRMEKMISDGNDYNIMDGEYILYIPFSL